jgi:histidine triad (HIT) family protein
VAQCVFCRIAAGEIPVALLLDTDEVVGFLDINPVNPGHALVVPRRHAEGLLELTDEELAAAASAVQRVAAAVKAATGSPAFNVLQNDGRAAGQLIQHVHFHVIPRSPDDGFSLGWRQGSYGEGELDAMVERVRREL